MWLAAEEESFGRTLAQGMEMLQDQIEQARAAGRSSVPALEVFTLHDTHGFPHEMTRELLAEADLSIEGDFEELMEEQRERGRGGAGRTAVKADAGAIGALDGGPATRFTGYETEIQPTTVLAIRPLDALDGANGNGGGNGAAPTRLLVKLAESPFYAAGGGQVSDVGTIECEHGDCRARVENVLFLGEDRVPEVVVEAGTLAVGEQVLARVDHLARHKTECNHTATHLLQAALRERVGSHVRQAGSYVGPDKLRFDFSHGQALSAEELRDVEDQVNAWIARNDPVHAITTTLDEAKQLGAMALFGEKYGEVVRMVEVGEGRVLARAVRWHPRALNRRDRCLPDPPRDLELRQRQTHRGHHRPSRRSSCCASTTVCSRRSPRSYARVPRTHQPPSQPSPPSANDSRKRSRRASGRAAAPASARHRLARRHRQ